MSFSSLTHTLSQLTHWEQKRLQKLVDSPYFNTDRRMGRLLHHMLAHPEDNDRERLHHIADPSLEYRYKRLNNWLSDLNELVEEFLVQEQLRQDRPQRHILLMKSCQQRGLDRQYQKAGRGYERMAQRNETEDTETLHWHGYQIALWEDRHALEQRRPQMEFLQQGIASLEQAYLIALLKAACQWRNRQNVIQTEDTRFWEGILAEMKVRLKREDLTPLAGLYQQVWLTLDDPEDVSHFQHLVHALDQRRAEVSKGELKPLYQYAQNYCIKQANQGKLEYLSTLFELYQAMIDLGLIFHQGYLQPADLKNIVRLGVRLERFSWTQEFLDSHAQSLPAEGREGIIAYNQAYLLHAKGELRQALRHLREAELTDVYYYLGARSLLLKIYFELQDHEGLEGQLEAFTRTLRRNKTISAYQRRIHLNLVSHLRRLSQLLVAAPGLDTKQYQKRWQELKQEVDTQPEIANVGWLRKQVLRAEGEGR